MERETYRLSTDLNGSGQKIALKNVLYLPELKRNLLSVQTMSKLGATVVFKEDDCRISKDSKLIGNRNNVWQSYTCLKSSQRNM